MSQENLSTPPAEPAPAPPPAVKARLASIDAYRGLVMFLIIAEGLRLARVAAALPESAFWAFLGYHQSHVEWVGCSLHDLIQPSFSFLVGVAMPFSIAARLAKGHSTSRLALHALWRSALLVALGVFLRSLGKPQTNFTFEDTLSQIGLGYFCLFLLGLTPVRIQWMGFGALLLGCWLAFALYPLPGPDFDWAAAGVASDWEHHLGGFAAHWNKNSNLAWAFDTWLLNLFPREKPFAFNGGGYSTLSFIPTLATMVLGLIAGGWLKSAPSPGKALPRLAIAGALGLALGWALGALGVCPVVKRIWTPSWTIFSGGWCFLLMAAFHGVIEAARLRAWAFPLVVFGANSIAAYLMNWLFAGFIRAALRRHLPEGFFDAFGAPYATLVEGALVLAALWFLLFWMYRRKLFLKI